LWVILGLNGIVGIVAIIIPIVISSARISMGRGFIGVIRLVIWR
jgi:hypothetical protein